MIFIVVKFTVKPEYAEEWLDRVDAFTQATRNEPGNMWFDWSRSAERSNEFVLVEAFQDDAAVAHVTAEHFKTAQKEFPPLLVKTPDIINFQHPDNEWSKLGEMEVPESA